MPVQAVLQTLEDRVPAGLCDGLRGRQAIDPVVSLPHRGFYARCQLPRNLEEYRLAAETQIDARLGDRHRQRVGEVIVQSHTVDRIQVQAHGLVGTAIAPQNEDRISVPSIDSMGRPASFPLAGRHFRRALETVQEPSQRRKLRTRRLQAGVGFEPGIFVRIADIGRGVLIEPVEPQGERPHDRLCQLDVEPAPMIITHVLQAVLRDQTPIEGLDPEADSRRPTLLDPGGVELPAGPRQITVRQVKGVDAADIDRRRIQRLEQVRVKSGPSV